MISIHALLAESDPRPCPSQGRNRNFYPRSPCGERRSDWAKSLFWHLDFYPRSPCGERLPLAVPDLGKRNISIHALLAESDHWYHISKNAAMGFLSTLSLRRATYNLVAGSKAKCISIHALLAESDTLPSTPDICAGHFYPRSPCGERLELLMLFMVISYFYPRSPCGERPRYLCCDGGDQSYFYPRSPCGERRMSGGRL